MYFMDDFEYVAMFDALAKGTLQFQDLTSFHNEHRAFFAYILLMALGQFSNYSVLVEVYGCWFFIVCTLIFLFLVLRKVFSAQKSLLALLPISAALFCMRNYESFTYGTLIFSAFTMFISVFGLYALASWHSKADIGKLVTAIGSCFIASFSLFAGGMAVWPVGFLVLLFKAHLQESGASTANSLKANAPTLVIWGLCGVAATLMYYGTGLPVLPQVKEPFLHILLRDPLYILHFFIRLFDSAIVSFKNDIAGLGLIALIVFSTCQILRTVILKRMKMIDDERHDLFFFGSAVMASGLLNSMLITYGRATFLDVHFATAPRYVQWTTLALIGCYLVGLSFSKQFGLTKQIVLLASTTFIAIGFASGVSVAEQSGPNVYDGQRWRAYLLSSYKQQSAMSLAELHPGRERLLDVARILEMHRWSVFGSIPDPQSMPKIKTPQNFQITITNPQPESNGDVKLDRKKIPQCLFQGWAIDTGSGLPSKQVFLRAGDRILLGLTGQKSPDLVQLTHVKKWARSGFAISFGSEVFPPGNYPLHLLIVDSSGKGVFESTLIGRLIVE